MKYCMHCGKEVGHDQHVCLACGQKVSQSVSTKGKSLPTLSVFFGFLGFFPLLLSGAIAGVVLAVISLNQEDHGYKGRAKLGLGVSIGSLAFALIIMIIALIGYLS